VLVIHYRLCRWAVSGLPVADLLIYLPVGRCTWPNGSACTSREREQRAARPICGTFLIYPLDGGYMLYCRWGSKFYDCIYLRYRAGLLIETSNVQPDTDLFYFVLHQNLLCPLVGCKKTCRCNIQPCLFGAKEFSWFPRKQDIRETCTYRLLCSGMNSMTL